MSASERKNRRESGFTLVEVIVAMGILMIVMTGFLYTITSSLSITRDTRTRVVAANLASQEIDQVRSSSDVFDVTSYTRAPITLNGDVFHVKVTESWATSHGATASCETGTAVGSLAYKQVTVTVTWDNMRGDRPVRSDTLMAPKTKINDPTLGTVLVGVIDASGTGVAGAKVTISASGVAASTTDGDGCAYLLKVPTGDYTVTASKSGYVSNDQLDAPTATVKSTAGNSSRVSFALDQAATFSTHYAANYEGSPKIPTNLDTTFVSTYGNNLFAPPTTANAKSLKLFPIPSGYTVLAGKYEDARADASSLCLATDPGQWAAGTRGGVNVAGTRPAAVAGAPGSTVDANVSMGVVRISSGANGSGNYLKAVYVGGGDGDPGCNAGMTYTFGNVLSSSNVDVALPYGTWKLYRGNSGAQNTQITTGLSVQTVGGAGAGIVTLDPREPV